MNKKELKAIYNIIAAAEEAISLLACENFPYTSFPDKDLDDMFYQLNDMCILLNKKIDEAKAKAETA